MKKRIFILITIACLSITLYMNESFQIDYDVNIFEYVSYSGSYTLEEVEILKKYSPLVFGGNFFEPPLGKFYDDSNQYVGYMVDYTNALAIELETDIITKPMVWADALEALKKGETDICDMVPSEERGVHYAFSDRLYNLNGVVLVSKQNTIESLRDLTNQRVAVQAGDYIIDQFDELDIEIEKVAVDNLLIAMDLLNEGQVAAIAGDDIVIKAMINDPIYNNQFKILDEAVYESMGVIAVPKDNADLIPVINKGIFKLKRAGIDEKIETKWFNLAKDTSLEKLKRMVLLALVYLIIGIYLIVEWNNRIRHLVDERTKELQEKTAELNNVIKHIRSYLLLIDKDGSVLQSNLEKQEVEKVILKQVTDELSGKNVSLSKIKAYTSFEYSLDRVYYACQVIPFKSDDNKQLIILTDITSDKLQEIKVNHSNKMEAVGRLAAGVAHEIRNPLGIIRNSNFLLNDYSSLDDGISDIVGIIDSAVTRTNRIIENLLDYSREENHLVSVIHLKTFIDETLVFYNTKIKRRNIKVSVSVAEKLTLRTNGASLRHILINLISNSIDAGSQTIEIKSDLKSDQVTLILKDDGKGIAADKIEKIFDPFFTTKAVGEGTGLGLYIVYSEVQKIDADISVESKVDVGTCFTLTFNQD